MPASALQTLVKIADTDLQQSLTLILEETLAHVVRHIGGHSGSTMLINEETGALEMVATFGLPADYIDRIYARGVPITCSPAGIVLKTGACYVVPNIFNEPRDRWWADLGKEFGFSAQLFMPMNHKGKLIGLLNVYMPDPHDYSENEIAFVNIAASHAAAVIENARLYKELVKKTSVLEREIKERHDFEHALHEQKELQARIFEVSSIGIGMVEIEGTTLEARKLSWTNDAMLRLFGFDPHEDEYKSYFGKSSESIYASRAEFERVSQLFQHELRRGNIAQTDAKFKRKDGSLFDGFVKLSLFDPSEPRKGAVATISDISWRKQAEERLRQKEETARALLNATLDAAWLQGRDGEILALNDRMAQRYGKSADELIGTCVYDLFPPELARVRRAAVDRVISAKQPYRFEDECEGRIYDVNLYPVSAADGTVTHIAIFSRDITEQKRAEQALEYSEKMYRTLFESTGAALMVIEEDMTIVHVNDELVSLLGYQKEEIEGKVQWPELVADADREQMMTYHRLRRADHPEGAPASYEFQFIHKNGELRAGSLVVGMIPGTRRSVVALRDITAQKRIEQDLQQSEARYRTIFEATRAPTVILEEDGTFALTNMAGVKISGYSSKVDLEGKRKWTEFIASPDDLAKMQEIHRQRRSAPDKAPRSYEFLFKDCHGNQKNICCTAAVIPGTKRSVVSFMDMTERRKTEVALRESEERFRSFFDELALGIFMINPEGQIIAANKAICQLMGYAQGELVGQHVSAFYPADEADTDTTWYATSVAEEQSRSVTERRFMRKNGETLWTRLHLTGVKDTDGNVKHATVLCEDVTEYKNLAETLIKKRQDVENLLTQLNRMERALNESEKKYKEITEFLPDLIYKSILIDS
ncbi:MAG: PAS domain S-box protein [Methanomicrobia archaeon]|nr:PAS domain S-box protein [Methanomicrobia archaeon]